MQLHVRATDPAFGQEPVHWGIRGCKNRRWVQSNFGQFKLDKTRVLSEEWMLGAR